MYRGYNKDGSYFNTESLTEAKTALRYERIFSKGATIKNEQPVIIVPGNKTKETFKASTIAYINKVHKAYNSRYLEFKRMYQDGYRLEDIAQHLNLTLNTVKGSKYLGRYNENHY